MNGAEARTGGRLSGWVSKGWVVVVPIVAVTVLVATWGRELPLALSLLLGAALIGAVLAAVHHAEVVAHRVGEPFGSLVLAVAVTIIEVGLILVLMVSEESHASTLARDTVFSAVMITLNGIVGLSLLVGSLRHQLPRFNSEGTGAALAVLTTLTTLTLVLPTFTISDDNGQYTTDQLAFVAFASLVLYAAYVLTQTRTHRNFFRPVAKDGRVLRDDDHADPPSMRTTLISVGLLVASLVAVVGLAEGIAPVIEAGVTVAGVPESFIGVVIALMILLPEGISAVRAALGNRLQTSFNLGIGSAIASIGLTIPVIAAATIWLPGALTLGLGPVQIVLFGVTIAVSILTMIPGRATRLQGIVHLALFAAFLFLSISP